MKMRFALILVFFLFGCFHDSGPNTEGLTPTTDHSQFYLPLPFKAEEGAVYLKKSTDNKGENYVDFPIMGVNLSVAEPGTYAGELAATEETYLRWLTLIKEANINTIRVYTLHFPRFYTALNTFNQALEAEGDSPLYVLHGIWLDEEYEDPENKGLYSMTEFFRSGITEVVDAVHGKGEIAHRFGRAYGKYTVDVSKWVAGYIVGREIYGEEVFATNLLNESQQSFSGEYLSLTRGNPTEVWLTANMDFLIAYEQENYQTQRPVGFSSWPTLDPMEHPSEQNGLEDLTYIDLTQIDTKNSPAGVFYNFHVYPYYPDFISSDKKYQEYSDSDGPNSYLGYLVDLRQHYSNRPLVAAEFGLPSSYGMAHKAHSGMHHGGMTEEQQADSLVRSFNNIFYAGWGGAVAFAFIDEWWKQNWFNAYTDIPRERKAFWHNAMDPEQHYGLLAFDSPYAALNDLSTSSDYSWTGSAVTDVKMKHNAKHLYIEANLLASPKDGDVVYFAIDTRDKTLGGIIPNTSPDETNNRSEFLLQLSYVGGQWTSELKVLPSYNIFGLTSLVHNPEVQTFKPVLDESGQWSKMTRIINYTYVRTLEDKTHFYAQPENQLAETGLIKTYNNENEIPVGDNPKITVLSNKISVFLPWGLLYFTDPSSKMLIDGYTDKGYFDAKLTDGIRLSVAYNDQIQGETGSYNWEAWSQNGEKPAYNERLKPAYYQYKTLLEQFGANF